MENKSETKVSYDDRRKELTQHFTSEQDVKLGEEVVGNAKLERKAVFKEDGIRMILGDLKAQQAKLEQNLKKLKAAQKEVPEMTEELKELEKKIQIINDFNKNKQGLSQIEATESDLKLVKKDIRQIKETIGSRLQL